MRVIEDSRHMIYERMRDETTEFRNQIIHTRREIDAIYLRLYKLIL